MFAYLSAQRIHLNGMVCSEAKKQRSCRCPSCASGDFQRSCRGCGAILIGGAVRATAQSTSPGSTGTVAQGTSKASVKMANKAAAKVDAKTAVPKAVKGKGAATKSTPVADLVPWFPQIRCAENSGPSAGQWTSGRPLCRAGKPVMPDVALRGSLCGPGVACDADGGPRIISYQAVGKFDIALQAPAGPNSIFAQARQCRLTHRRHHRHREDRYQGRRATRWNLCDRH